MSSSAIVSVPCSLLVTSHKVLQPSKLSLTRQLSRSLKKLQFLAWCFNAEPTGDRRSADYYKDCIWDHDYIQNSMQNYYSNDVKFIKLAEKLVQQVEVMLLIELEQTKQLEMVDDLQRLGLTHRFEEEIKATLEKIYLSYYSDDGKYSTITDIHTAALAFRLLRQHGYKVSQEMFRCFMDKDTSSFPQNLRNDVKGMISLYEASHLSIEGETILEHALDFTSTYLEQLNVEIDPYLEVLRVHALEMPLHWRSTRLEARWFIEEAYVKRPNMSPLLLQLAKLEFNLVQGMHQNELKDLSSWWTRLELMKGMRFARDSLVVGHLWSIHIYPEPKYETCRRVSTKAVTFISLIDDSYDIYGTLEELELFTNAVDRWNTGALKQLPNYMKKLFLAFYNIVNEMAYEALRDKGIDVTDTLKNTWTSLVRSYMQEARWYHTGYRPKLDEYMGNARISIAGPLVAVQSHIFGAETASDAELKYLEDDPNLVKWASIIFRFCDDLATSSDEMARGDVPKSIECYMNETGETEEVARKYIRKLVREGWQKLNRYKVEEKTLSTSTVERLLNMVRGSHCFYQHGDGHGIQNGDTRLTMSKLIFDPIPLDSVDETNETNQQYSGYKSCPTSSKNTYSST